jgi:hypothetical protein
MFDKRFALAQAGRKFSDVLSRPLLPKLQPAFETENLAHHAYD